MRWRGIDDMRWRGVDDMRQRGIDDMRWRGIDDMRWRGIEDMRWRGIDEMRGRGIDRMRWIGMDCRYMRGIYYWGCCFDSFLRLLLSVPYYIRSSSALVTCSLWLAPLLACHPPCIIVRALETSTFLFTGETNRAERSRAHRVAFVRFHAQRVASARSHASHAPHAAIRGHVRVFS
jgi:hypothetical protein